MNKNIKSHSYKTGICFGKLLQNVQQISRELKLFLILLKAERALKTNRLHNTICHKTCF